MAVEATFLPAIKGLNELVSLVEIKDPKLCSQLKHSIEELKNVAESLKDINDPNIKILEAVYNAEDTVDAFQNEIRHKAIGKIFSGVIHLRYFYIQARFTNKMEKFVNEVKVKSGEMHADKRSNDENAEKSAENSRSSAVGNAASDSILDSNKEVKELAELLMDNQSSLFNISVVDVARSAMTNELWKLYQCEPIKKHFELRAWVPVPVPEEFEKSKLVIEIMRQVITGSEVDEQLSPQQELRNFLIQKRYLVVLTNVRTPDIWEILKNLFPNSSNGSRVILSFQEADAARCRNTSFFGGELSFIPKDMPVAYAESEDDGSNLPEQVSDAEIEEEETDIVGMKDEIVKLAKPTLSGGKKYFLISVVGGAGSGKTTLVKTIYNSSYTRRNFEYRAWVNVYVSNDFDMKNVLVNILEQLTKVKVEEELPLDELESKLKEVLDQKKYLVVLDDVHLPGAWYDIKWIFSPKSSPTGSRVILITRETHVARSFSQSIFLHQLRPLNIDETRELFLKKVRSEKSYTEILGKICEICNGNPLAIGVLGGLLSTLSEEQWSEVIDKIMPGKKKGTEQEASDNDQSLTLDQLDTSSIWGFAYEYLSPYLKACLHYLLLFPKSYEISVRRLLQLWLAERLVTPNMAPKDQAKAPPEDLTPPPERHAPLEHQAKAPPKDQAPPEEQAKTDFEQLERRNMIEVVKWSSDGKPKTCRLSSTLYDNLFPNAENRGGFHIHHRGKSNSTPISSDVRRLAEHLDVQDKLAADNHFKYLHSYLSFDKRKGDKPADEVGDLLSKTITKRGYGLLRVLDLERVYKSVLPETIGKLQLLRYVGLRWTFLDSIPESVGHLPCIETLDVKHTNIATLPMSIWKSKTLRHLFMNDIHLPIPKSFVKYSLTNLQTLWGLLIGNKSPQLEWLKNLRGLRKLGLTFHKESLEGITNWIKSLTSLESLRLRSINDFSEPSDLDFGSLGNHEKLTELYLLGKLPRAIDKSTLPPNLRILTLSLSHLSEDPMPELGHLKELNILRLFAHSYIGEQMTCQERGFTQLRVLKLWVLKELKEWTIEEEGMPALRDLEIRNCQKLNKPIGLEKVTTLKELTLTDMKEDFENEIGRSMAKKVIICNQSSSTG